MSITRRKFITRAAAFSTLIALPRFAWSEITIGNAKLRTVSDGSLTLPKDFILGGLNAAETAPLLEKYNIRGDTLTPPCNVTLYEDGENIVLFDAGSGPDFQASAGDLLASLEAIGIAPEDITHVIFTHAHPDHIWGMIDDFDEPTFSNAQHMMGRKEWDYWWNPETVESIGAERQAFAVGAKRRMELIENQVEFFDDNQEILPSILAVMTPGHTPGHMSFEIRQGGEAYMLTGDAISNHYISFEKPDWQIGSDQDPEMGAATRVKLFERIVADDIGLIGFHLPEGGIGRAEQMDSGYIYVAENG